MKKHGASPDGRGGATLPALHAGDGRQLLLMPGFGSSPGDYRPAVEALAPRYEVLVPDWARTARKRWSADRAAAALVATLDTFGFTAPAVVGHSFGGAVAAEFVRRWPQRCEHLVFVDSIAQSERLTYLANIARNVTQGDDRGDGGGGGTSRSSARVFAREWARTAPQLMSAALWGFFSDRTAALDVVRARAIPVSVVWGEGDAILDVEDGRRFARAVGADFHVVDVGRGPVRHQWMIRHPGRFAETLDKVLGAGSPRDADI